MTRQPQPERQLPFRCRMVRFQRRVTHRSHRANDVRSMTIQRPPYIGTRQETFKALLHIAQIDVAPPPRSHSIGHPLGVM